MSHLKEFFIGIFLGIANIIPGVSGGTIALSMGIYEILLSSVNNLKKDFWGSVKTLLPYGIGAVIGILCFTFIIEFCLTNFPIPTFLAFIGLILGGLPSMFNKVKSEKIKWTHIIVFIIAAIVVVVPTIMVSGATDVVRAVEFNFVSVVIMFLIGIIAAFSIVVPGVSGSMILMMIGYYATILNAVTTFIKAGLSFDFVTAFSMCGILIPMGLGAVVGVFVTADITEKIMKRYPIASMWGIIALVVTSPFAILYGVNFVGATVTTWMVAVLALVIGFLVARKMEK